MILRRFADATLDLLARRPPARSDGSKRRPKRPEAFVLSDGAFQAPVGLQKGPVNRSQYAPIALECPLMRPITPHPSPLVRVIFSAASGATFFAMPKSRTLICAAPFAVRCKNTFDGLRSRWT